MQNLVVKLAIIIAILILSLGVFYGSFLVGKNEGEALCQAQVDQAVEKERNKIGAVYAKIDKSLPAGRAKLSKWLLQHSAGNRQ